MILLTLVMTLATSSPAAPQGIVQRHGRLQVKQGQLCGASGEPVQLRGMSSHDLKSFPFTTNTIAHLVDDWRVSVIRAAMYTDSYGSSYIHEPAVKTKVKLIVEEALRRNVYVIIDWHILQDSNPNQYRTEAKAFFEEMARAYGRNPHVLYEICNEPNGTNVAWKDIKTYAEFVIPAIRAIDPHNVIIVGTDTWSQGVLAAAESPLAYSNVMYALHFYAGSHREALRHQADKALAKGAAIFVSEWGLTDATGAGPLYLAEAQAWMDWMNAHNVSWANWSLSNADEGSAALKPGARLDGPWPDAYLNASGKWIKDQLSHVAERD